VVIDLADDKTRIMPDGAKGKDTKAGALLCPICCVEYVEVVFDLEVGDVVLYDVAALRCPVCAEEVFSPQQQEEIRKKSANRCL
jgi:hypothetical protein